MHRARPRTLPIEIDDLADERRQPDLRPEVAETTVIGLVCHPRWAEGLRTSIDRYEVDIADSIATLGAQDERTRTIVSRFGARATDNAYDGWGRHYRLAFRTEF